MIDALSVIMPRDEVLRLLVHVVDNHVVPCHVHQLLVVDQVQTGPDLPIDTEYKPGRDSNLLETQLVVNPSTCHIFTNLNIFFLFN